MGGAQAGEVASRMAVEAFQPELPDGPPADVLAELIVASNRRIHETSVQDERRSGMGTTVTAAYVGEGDVTIAHVGDSRAYLLRRGELTRLTTDHSLVGELVARGKLTEEQAETHPQRNVITRSVGPEPEVQVDTETYPAQADDVFLICSDGLTTMVPEAFVTRVLTQAPSLAAAGRKLISAANEAGGRDNITVILFRLEEVEPGRAARRSAGEEQPTLVGEDAPQTSEVRRAVALAERPEPRPDPQARRAPDPPGAPDRPPPPPAAAGPARRRRIPPAAIVVFVVAIPVISGMLLALRAVYFVGVDPKDGRTITVFRGLPYELPFGVSLYSRYGGSGVTIDAVPPARRPTFTDHKLRARDDAVDLVDELELGRLEP